MKLLLAALVVTFAIAVTASVFAIWPAVADAPWEDGTDSLRCEAALELRDGSMKTLRDATSEFQFGEAQSQHNFAQEEIDRHC